MKTKHLFLNRPFRNTACLTAFAVAALLFFIGCATIPPSSVAVSGTGTVTAEPDMISMSVTLRHTAKTTREAQTEVNRKVAQVLDLLKQSGVEERHIRTASLNFDQEYQYINNSRTLMGQRVNQTISFTVYDIKTNPDIVPRLLDNLTAIDKLELGSINFDIKEKAALFSQSRALAWEKALQKAGEYATMAGMEVDRAVGITEGGNADIYAKTSNTMMRLASGAPGVEMDYVTALPSGEIEITTQVSVTFLLK